MNIPLNNLAQLILDTSTVPKKSPERPREKEDDRKFKPLSSHKNPFSIDQRTDLFDAEPPGITSVSFII